MTRFRRFAAGVCAAAAAADTLAFTPSASAAGVPRSGCYGDFVIYAVPYSGDLYVSVDPNQQLTYITQDEWVDDARVLLPARSW